MVGRNRPKVSDPIVEDTVVGIRAEMRFSKAAARGARYPPRLTPIRAIF